MFKRKQAKLKTLEAKIESLTDDKERLEADLRRIKHEHKMEEEDTKHLVKMRQEKVDIEFQRKKTELAGEHQEDLARVRDEYRDKLEKRLEEEIKNIRGMYDAILERLPNVNLKMKD